MSPGSTPSGDGRWRFRVWAPNRERVELILLVPQTRRVAMQPVDRGFHEIVADATPGDRYFYGLADGVERPDPASRCQPLGVHGPSEIVEHDFPWTDDGWHPPSMSEQVFYELHVGTFTPEGSFDAIVPRLDELADLGVTTLQLMPVAAFPGDRNWGYDGVSLYATHSAYGGVDGLRRLVDACHRRGLAVFLDVVYNHLGPEGNYLGEFGPYFTERYRTPWGAALNFDGPGADEVRSFFIDNALWWTIGCHLDGLRLDAVHAIQDVSAFPLVEELTRVVHAAARAESRVVQVVAESASNDPRLVRRPEEGGFGMDGQWNDDFHHAVHALLTAERHGYYADYGEVSTLAKSFREGYVLTGERSVFYERRHGRPATGVPPSRLVVFSQNHDQTGNRAGGERLDALIDPASCRLAAAVVLLSPFVPLLFMGEEHADPAPFLYFTSHGDPALTEAVRRGRREEFAAFADESEAADPGAESTFARSRIDWSLRQRPGPHADRLAFYRTLIALRRETGGGTGSVLAAEADDAAGTLLVRRGGREAETALLCCFTDEPRPMTLPPAPTGWTRRLDSADTAWGGPGADSPERTAAGVPTVITVASRTALLYVSGDVSGDALLTAAKPERTAYNP